MKQTKLMMGMPIAVEILDANATPENFAQVFAYFSYVDHKFSTHKEDSEISLINQGKIQPDKYSNDMKTIFRLSELTKQETDGYFDILHLGKYDPSGVVKGWAILNATKLIKNMGFTDYYVDAGGDIQVSGKNSQNNKWRIGIKNPFNQNQIVKALYVNDEGVATSGTYIRGQHIYNPKNSKLSIDSIVSLTVIGPNIYEADRFATAAFAMETDGIIFIESLPGFEGYMIDKNGQATFTRGFERYTYSNLDTKKNSNGIPRVYTT
jgi:FAD:protein FMN transferase